MATTTYLSEQIVDTFFVGSKFVALHTGDPGTAGTANELTTGTDANYARKAVTLAKVADGAVFTAKNSGSVAMNAGAAGVNYTITHITIKSAVSAGNTLAVLPLVVPISVSAGTVVSFAINDIVVRGESDDD
jgi:hypothetical protein